jgi:RNA polymerase sigma-70 factor (ECF subfamily)
VERDLVVRAREGDRDAFARLAAASFSRLDGAARLITRDRERARDAVQETLTRAWRDLPTLRDPDRFEAWLHRLLVRACIDEFRRARTWRLEVVMTDTHQPAIGGIEAEVADRDEIERGFRRLAPDQRAVIVLHFYLGMSLADTALALNVPAGTARSRLHRAVGAMRAALEADARGPVDVLEGRPA